MPAEMGINMNYAEIKYCDIANGPGVRTSLFVSGCTHHCPGCFNEIAWDFEYGKPFTQETIDAILASLEPGYIAGLTLLGGEPFEYANQQGLLPLLQQTKSRFPQKTSGVLPDTFLTKTSVNRCVKNGMSPAKCFPILMSLWTENLCRNSKA